MANTIVLTKRTGGGFKAVINNSLTIRFSRADYSADDYGVKIWTTDNNQILRDQKFQPQEWNIDGNSNYTTVDAVCQALEAIGVLRASEPITGASTAAKQDDQSALLTSIRDGRKLYRTFYCMITRAAGNGAAYSPNQVIGDQSGNLPVFVDKSGNKIGDVFPGKGIKIYRLHLQTTDKGTNPFKGIVHIYDDLTTPNIADRQAFVINDANIYKRRGSIEVVTGAGNRSKVGHVDYVQLGSNPLSANGSLGCMLESPDGFTPFDATSTQYLLEIDCELD
jgi:hypothetical protein